MTSHDTGSSSGNAWRGVAVLTGAAVISYADREVLNLLIDPIKTDLKISDVQMGLLQGASFSIVYATTLLVMGYLADTTSRRRLLCMGLALWSLATFAFGYGQGFAALALARLFVGIGEAVLTPTAMSLIADLFPPSRRGVATGIFITGSSLGSGVALIGGGALYQSALGGNVFFHLLLDDAAPWRFPFVLLGLIGLLFSLAPLAFSDPPRTRAGSDGTQRTASLRSVIRQLYQLRARLLPVVLAAALMGISGFAAISWAPTLLSRQFGIDVHRVGQLIGPLSIMAGILGSMSGGWLADLAARRHGTRTQLSMLTAIAVAGGISATMMAFSGLALVLVAYSILLLTNGLCGTLAMTAIQGMAPPRMRGIVAAVLGFASISIGLSLGSLLTGLSMQELYGDSRAVGWAVATVSGPTALVATIFFYRAASAIRQTT